MDASDEVQRWAENDSLRSECIRRLVQSDELLATTSAQAISPIPRVIVQFWDNLSSLPRDVQECLESWTSLEAQGFERIIFDDIRAREFILRRFDSRHAAAYDLCHHPAMRCDYFRLCYLFQSGGFYIDADEVYQDVDCQELFTDARCKLQPLCYDVSTGSMISADDFQSPPKTSPHWIFYVNNNPLLAPPDHPLMQIALVRATDLLLSANRPLEIQSTTGPGNLSASLVKHSLELRRAGIAHDFKMIPNWDSISISRWPLSYRNDERNWRRWKPPAV